MRFLNDGMVNVVKGFLVILCMICIIESMNKDVQAEQNNKVTDAEVIELRAKAKARYDKVVAKYKNYPTQVSKQSK